MMTVTFAASNCGLGKRLAAVLLIVLPLWLALPSLASAAADLTSIPSPTCHLVNASADRTQTVHHAGLAVSFGPDRGTKTFCIEFAEDSISGLELLQRSGLPLVTSGGGLGAAVCAIDGVGSNNPADYSSCFGQFPDYWAYYQFAGGSWHMSSLGASSTEVRDGSVEGWAWGAGAKPESPTSLCPASTPTAPAEMLPTVPPPSEGSPPPPAADAPAVAVSSPPSQEAAAATVAPQRTEGAAGPSRTAESPVPRTPTTTAQLIRAEEGNVNAQRSASAASSSGHGAVTGLIAFGAVATVFAVMIGLLWYRRRSIE